MADPEDDLVALRGFRQADAEPPAGLQARIEEQLWRAILAEEAAGASRPRRARRTWYAGLLRPAVAAGAAATIAMGVAFAGGGGEAGSGTTAGTTQAGILDSTATALFGDSVARTPTGGPLDGVIDLSSSDEVDETLVRGPRTTVSGELDQATRELVRTAPRDPRDLQAQLRTAAETAAGDDPSDRVAFQMAMQWVVAPQVPGDLRAAMLRSLDGMSGVDGAIMGLDLLGRSGLVLGHLDPRSSIRTQYMLALDGGTLLERRSFTTGYIDPACPPGTFTGHAIYDDRGAQITPADAPWLDWPLVVAACDPASSVIGR